MGRARLKFTGSVENPTPVPPTLGELTLSNSSIAEASPPGAIVATVLGVIPGGDWELIDDAGGRFAKSGAELVTGNTPILFSEGAQDIQTNHTLPGSTDNPTDHTITVTEVSGVPEVPDALAIDSWNFALVTASGSAPAETEAARNMYRAVASVTDLDLGGTYAASGDVRHTRPHEEPVGAIDSMRGRRSLHFVPVGSTAAYVTVSSAGCRTLAFATASGGTPARLFMGVRLRGSAARIGDGTLFDRNGWRARVSSDLSTVTLDTPASTSGGTTVFPWPNPALGYARYWLEFIFDGTTWTFKVNGELVTASATVAKVGTLTSDAAQALTVGGRASNGFEWEVDLLAPSNGATVATDVSQWREDALIDMSWGATNHCFLVDCNELYYNTFRGSDGLGLTVKEVTLLTDASAAGEWWTTWGSQNVCVLVRVCGCTERGGPFASRVQTTQGTASRTWPYGVLINASGGPFAAAGAEHRITWTGTRASKYTIMKGIGGGGPFTYFVQYQNEGAPFFVLGQDPGVTSSPIDLSNIMFMDCWSAFSADNALNFYWQCNNVYVVNFVAVGALRHSNHNEAPNHDYHALVANGATQASFINPVTFNIVQRVPGVLGCEGDALVVVHAYGSWVGGLTIPQNDRSRAPTQGMAVWGQASNVPGPTSGDGFLTTRQHVWKPRAITGGETQVDYAQGVKSGSGSPVQGSTIHSVGNYFANGSDLFASAHDPNAVQVNRPQWSGGERLFPLTQAGIEAVAQAAIDRLPTFVQDLADDYAAGDIVRHDMFTADPNHLQPTGASGPANITTLNGLLNDATAADEREWSLPANATNAPGEFTGTVRAWASISNGPALQALLNQRATATVLWPLAAPLLLS